MTPQNPGPSPNPQEKVEGNSFLHLRVPRFFVSRSHDAFGSVVAPDLLAEFGHRAPDEAQRRHNEQKGHSLCAGCGGTGNWLYSMYKPCEECGGSGVAEEYGACTPLDRWFFQRRDRFRRWRVNRHYNGPRNWNAEVRCWLSYWFGIGNWMLDGRDECHRCGALPSDVDFEMTRVGPRRIECMDRQSCEQVADENAALKDPRS